MGAIIIKQGGNSDARKRLENLIKSAESKYLKIGWFPSARYDDEESTPVAAVAAQNEYGNPNKHIPARPFLRPAITNYENNWKDIGNRGFKSVIAGKSTAMKVLDDLGISIAEDVKHSIAQVYEPALQKATIDARLNRPGRSIPSGQLTKNQALGISKPLVDTGYMLATVSHEISNTP